MPTIPNIILSLLPLLSDYAVTLFIAILAAAIMPRLIAAFRLTDYQRRRFERMMAGPAHRIAGRYFNHRLVEIMATIWEDRRGEERAEAEDAAQAERERAGEVEVGVFCRVLGMVWGMVLAVWGVLRMLARRWDEW
ncbi:hypothetical protein FQN50_005877 [Emmonsiellopsis sp. PD_5]|nr:hypothetical protein FQN50_005877 [Emmonsiellopsis sp. PD_5]